MLPFENDHARLTGPQPNSRLKTARDERGPGGEPTLIVIYSRPCTVQVDVTCVMKQAFVRRTAVLASLSKLWPF